MNQRLPRICAKFIQREIDNIKASWLDGIRTVVEAPEGSKIMVLPPDAIFSGSDNLQGVRIVNDPNAPGIILREEDFMKTYPFDYAKLTRQLNARYSDFIQNNQYHEIRRRLEANPRYCHKRLLNPENPRTGYKRFYSPEVVEEFDKHYSKH